MKLGIITIPIKALSRARRFDLAFAGNKSVRYLRYMDDIVILTKTRSALRRAIATCRTLVAQLKLTLSYEKTYVGKTAKAFTFLGYRFNGAAAMVDVAPQTISKSLARVTSLLEQQSLCKERLEKHVRGFVTKKQNIKNEGNYG